MIEILAFIFHIIHIALIYVLPIGLAAIAFVANNKEKMNRWLIHFLAINVLEYTFFPIFDFIGLSIISQTLSVVVLFLPTFYSFEQLLTLFKDSINSQIGSKLDIVRQQTLTGLQQFNLA